MHIQLAGSFRNIQIVFKESVNCFKRIFVQRFNGIFLENLIQEHLAQPCRKLIDNSAEAECIVFYNAFFRLKNRTDFNSDLRFLIAISQFTQMLCYRTDSDDSIDSQLFPELFPDHL